MNTTVDSASWTGVSGLTDAECTGVLTFTETTARLRRHRALAGVSAIVLAALAIALATETALLSGFAILCASALAIVRWLTQRIHAAPFTAPLILHVDRLQVGSSAVTIPMIEIAAIRPQAPQSPLEWLARLIYQGPLSAGLRPICLFRLDLKNNAPSRVLDLDVLDGEPDRIVRILDHRIQHAKT